MSKTNIETLSKEVITDVGQKAAVLLMAVAVTLGTFELSGRDHANKAILPLQPELAVAGEHNGDQNQIRREREETAPHHISYSEIQRTPSRSGKQ